MNYEERMQNVAVLGAAGKMGSGILLLTALEMADLSLKPEGKGKKYVINAIDVSDEALQGLMKYLRAQVLKAAEKKIVALRSVYKDHPALIENADIIDQYVHDVIGLVMPSTHLASALGSNLVFEAIKEDPELKVKIFSYINENNKNQPWFFTNTSSIPIGELDEKAKLGGRIIGFHFYNPPAVQKLVELIPSKNTLKEVSEFAQAYAKNLRKVLVPSNDVAGFIGNGHFMRDILYATGEVEKLQKEFGFVESVYAMNRISQDYLIRPMGIFQLIDYVGIDVCSYILSVMQSYMKQEPLHCPLLDQLLALGVKGGQFSDGSQKDGILKYEKGKVVGIYDPGKKAYRVIEEFKAKVDEKLGAMPAVQPWKSIVGNPGKEDILKAYFKEIGDAKSPGAVMTKAYALKSREIGVGLVSSGVAFSEKDVNTVLLTGFFHAYGPVNDYLN
ncbi:MAG: 3-hydroxyacyl-CoA dehydrogenase family protein [Bacteroidetes bacterium]|nr:3-hydroxyacyl-CoA dehydrogenase family protein [Bacteroidota bacterium]